MRVGLRLPDQAAMHAVTERNADPRVTLNGVCWVA